MAQTSTAYNDALYMPKPEPGFEQPKKQAKKQKLNTKLVTRVAMAVFFLMVFTVVLRYTMINEMTAQINTLEKQLQEITAANEQQTVYLDRSSDLKNVEQTAQTQLNMGIPQSHQVVNVTLNMKDKTVKPANGTNGFITSAKNIISYCLEYLY
ncbi:MAG: hypothetical protein IJE46_01135 [Clostridia bacterium]|nr:hypothetical protein [Clostridia bacterium]